MVMEEAEFNPHINQVLREMDTTGSVRRWRELAPSLVQYEIKPGAHATLVTDQETRIDLPFTILTVLNPEEFAGRWPDWKEREQRHYRLCEWYNAEDLDGYVGWFPLARMVELKSDAQFDELKSRIDSGESITDNTPPWLQRLYEDYLMSMNQSNPNDIAVPTKCGRCQGTNMALHVNLTVKADGKSGEMPLEGGEEGEVTYSYLTGPTGSKTFEAHLHCMDCQSRAHFSHEEIHKYGIDQLLI